MFVNGSYSTALIPYEADDPNHYGPYIPLIIRNDSSSNAKMEGNGYPQWNYLSAKMGVSYLFHKAAAVTIPINTNVYDDPNSSSPERLYFEYTSSHSAVNKPLCLHGVDSSHSQDTLIQRHVYNPYPLTLPIVGTCETTGLTSMESSWGAATSDIADALCIQVPLTDSIATLYNSSSSYDSYAVYFEAISFNRSTNSSVYPYYDEFHLGLMTTYTESSSSGGSMKNNIIINEGIYCPTAPYSDSYVSLRNGYDMICGFKGWYPLHIGNLTSSTAVTKNLYIIPAIDYPSGGASAASVGLAINIYVGYYVYAY